MTAPARPCRIGERLLVLALLLAPAAAGAQPASAPASGERLLREAIGHYDMGRFEASLRTLELAEKASTDDATLARVLLQRGVTLAVLGQTDRARQSFVLALRRDPSLSLDPGRVKPAIVSLLRSVQTSRDAPRATPPDASITEDGSATLRPGTRPFAATLSIGGAAGLGSAAGGFALSQELGYHFSRTARGLALTLALCESFGSKGSGPAGTAPRVSLYQLGAKLSLDLQPSRRTALYLSPLLQLAFAHASSAVVDSSESTQAFAIRAGLEVKLIFEDRFLLYARPASVDLLIGTVHLARIVGEASGGGVLVRLDFAIGAGVIF